MLRPLLAADADARHTSPFKRFQDVGAHLCAQRWGWPADAEARHTSLRHRRLLCAVPRHGLAEPPKTSTPPDPAGNGAGGGQQASRFKRFQDVGAHLCAQRWGWPLVAALGGCAPPPLPDTGTVTTPAPSIRTIFPASSEDVVYCSTFPVVVAIENFTLSADHLDGDEVDAEGHWHLFDSDIYLFAAADEWTVLPPDKALADGRHALIAQLVTNEHQPLDPDVNWLTEITVDNSSVDENGDPNCLGGGTGAGAIY